MARMQLAAFAAALAFSTPGLAFDPNDIGPSTVFYVSIPLGWDLERRDRGLTFGLQLQGRREYQAVRIDSKILNFLPAGGLEAKWLIAGIVAAGAAMALGSKDKSTTRALQAQQTQHQQQQQQQQQPQPCPPAPACK